ncbi:MAG: hypothetical protein MHM6MM_004241 [Cercozoa sp. M6MM]
MHFVLLEVYALLDTNSVPGRVAALSDSSCFDDSSATDSCIEQVCDVVQWLSQGRDLPWAHALRTSDGTDLNTAQTHWSVVSQAGVSLEPIEYDEKVRIVLRWMQHRLLAHERVPLKEFFNKHYYRSHHVPLIWQLLLATVPFVTLFACCVCCGVRHYRVLRLRQRLAELRRPCASSAGSKRLRRHEHVIRKRNNAEMSV